jgi:hypothetical protein
MLDISNEQEDTEHMTDNNNNEPWWLAGTGWNGATLPKITLVKAVREMAGLDEFGHAWLGLLEATNIVEGTTTIREAFLRALDKQAGMLEGESEHLAEKAKGIRTALDWL